ncbi:Uma2 family endonuclease [Leptolyngbya sp. FACHB-671]|nr:Uma2 family endonuclease [Leptolyngbya sp. FACHB-671]MBD2070249.1 Uma2 family endonuclease [Leptolyngbya sp. FACHB-671]
MLVHLACFYLSDRGVLQNEAVLPDFPIRQQQPLVIEVVRPNWWDDYGHKLVEYEAMGIAEYWIVDFCALGAIRHIGKPKQPNVTVCQLIEDEYQMQRFIAGQRLKSGIFPNLELSTDAIFQAAEL